MAGDNRKDDANLTNDSAKPRPDPLKIVRPKPPESGDLDLDVGDLEQDRRYGREDIADK